MTWRTLALQEHERAEMDRMAPFFESDEHALEYLARYRKTLAWHSAELDRNLSEALGYLVTGTQDMLRAINSSALARVWRRSAR